MEGLDYSQIWLQPKYSTVSSRGVCDTSVVFGKRRFKLPVVPANMKTIIGPELALHLARDDYFYIMHRFDVDIVDFCQFMKDHGVYQSISIGVNKEANKKIFEELDQNNLYPEFITIDIAHGHSKHMKETIKFVKGTVVGKKAFLIGGNVCTPEGAEDLARWGCDAVKVGVGPGSPCTTRLQTGFTCPQFTAVEMCARTCPVPIIADGGIKYVGDIAKSLVAGATMVMAGGMFAGHDECPGTVERVDGKLVKEYYGSASAENKGKEEFVEGMKIIVEYKGPIERTLTQIQHGLQSAISYAGGNDLSAFNSVKYIVQH
jgi:GMP reductase